jgi:hypothetical protein
MIILANRSLAVGEATRFGRPITVTNPRSDVTLDVRGIFRSDTMHKYEVLLNFSYFGAISINRRHR